MPFLGLYLQGTACSRMDRVYSRLPPFGWQFHHALIRAAPLSVQDRGGEHTREGTGGKKLFFAAIFFFTIRLHVLFRGIRLLVTDSAYFASLLQYERRRAAFLVRL